MYFEMLYCYANCIKTRISVSTRTCSFKMISKCTNQDKVSISKTYTTLIEISHVHTILKSTSKAYYGICSKN